VRGLQCWPSAAGQHHQARQLSASFLAGRSSTSRSTLGCGLETAVCASGERRQRNIANGHVPKTGSSAVLDVAERLGIFRVGQVRFERGTARSQTWRELERRRSEMGIRSLAGGVCSSNHGRALMKRCLGRTETDRKITGEPWVVDAGPKNTRTKSFFGVERRSAAQKRFDRATLLECLRNRFTRQQSGRVRRAKTSRRNRTVSLRPTLATNLLYRRSGETYDARVRGPNRKSRIRLCHSELVQGSYQLHIEGNMNKPILSVLPAIGMLGAGAAGARPGAASV